MPTHSFQQPDSSIVIGIAGRIGAGKTSVGRHLSSAHSFYYIRYSQVLADWLAEDPEGKAQLQSVGWEVMAGGMQTELNSRLISSQYPILQPDGWPATALLFVQVARQREGNGRGENATPLPGNCGGRPSRICILTTATA